MGNYYDQGVLAAQAFLNSKHFARFDNRLPAELVARLFLPSVEEGETKMLISRPLDKSRREWLAGYTDRRSALLHESV